MSAAEATAWICDALRGDHLPSPPDPWQPVFTAALENGCAALLHGSTESLAVTPPESELYSALEAHSKRCAVFEMGQLAALRQALQRLSALELPFLVLKGTALAYRLYPQPFFRERCDTDLLFGSREEAELALAALETLGYARRNSVSGKLVRHQFSCVRTLSSGQDSVLDVHWKLSNRSQFSNLFSFEDLYASSVPLSAITTEARGLSTVHALLHALLHRAAHKAQGTENRLIWLWDIHLLIAGMQQAELEAFTDLAVRHRLSAICVDGLTACEAALGTTVPAALSEPLSAHAENDPRSLLETGSRASQFFADLGALDSLADKGQFVWETLIPPADYMLQKYRANNRLLLPWLYLRRVVAGVWAVLGGGKGEKPPRN